MDASARTPSQATSKASPGETNGPAAGIGSIGRNRSGRARWKGRSSSTVWDRAGTLADCTTPGQAVRRRAAGRAADVFAATLTLAARLAAGFSAGFFFPAFVASHDPFSAG